MAEKLALGVSALKTGNYISISIEFGSEEFLRPDLVKDIKVTLKNKLKKSVRDLETSNNFQNSDGSFIVGTILYQEEEITEVHASCVATDGKIYKAKCDVADNPDKITVNTF